MGQKLRQSGAQRVYFGRERSSGKGYRRLRIFDPGAGSSYFRAARIISRADLPGGVAEGVIWKKVIVTWRVELKVNGRGI